MEDQYELEIDKQLRNLPDLDDKFTQRLKRKLKFKKNEKVLSSPRSQEYLSFDESVSIQSQDIQEDIERNSMDEWNQQQISKNDIKQNQPQKEEMEKMDIDDVLEIILKKIAPQMISQLIMNKLVINVNSFIPNNKQIMSINRGLYKSKRHKPTSMKNDRLTQNLRVDIAIEKSKSRMNIASRTHQNISTNTIISPALKRRNQDSNSKKDKFSPPPQEGISSRKNSTIKQHELDESSNKQPGIANPFIRKFKTQREKQNQKYRENGDSSSNSPPRVQVVKGSNSMNEVESDDLADSEREDNDSMTNDTMILKKSKKQRQYNFLRQHHNYQKIKQQHNDGVSNSNAETSNQFKFSVSSVDDQRFSKFGRSTNTNHDQMSQSRMNYQVSMQNMGSSLKVPGVNQRQIPLMKSQFNKQRDSIEEGNEDQFFITGYIDQSDIKVENTNTKEMSKTMKLIRTSFGQTTKYPKFIKILNKRESSVIRKQRDNIFRASLRDTDVQLKRQYLKTRGNFIRPRKNLSEIKPELNTSKFSINNGQDANKNLLHKIMDSERLQKSYEFNHRKYNQEKIKDIHNKWNNMMQYKDRKKDIFMKKSEVQCSFEQVRSPEEQRISIQQKNLARLQKLEEIKDMLIVQSNSLNNTASSQYQANQFLMTKSNQYQGQSTNYASIRTSRDFKKTARIVYKIDNRSVKLDRILALKGLSQHKNQ
ncbi:UNKNOWN [Stylonychia lemnae]|uniref:Uncharacterized protein n=1 Tax=Stylonychia lemnae TaxID=5949 RepID=A0A078B1P2_STYLE|nr:UNKNOWN [Stylonychia lemnae]|eukprot:CDW88485.1 UNKNOWN [Stylonychia lemnae]